MGTSRSVLKGAKQASPVESLRNLCVLDKMFVCCGCLGLASGERCLQDRKLLVDFKLPEAVGLGVLDVERRANMKFVRTALPELVNNSEH